jgi:CysZ protein
MIEAFLKTVREMFRPLFWGVFFLNLIITALFFWGLVVSVGELVSAYAINYSWLEYVAEGGVIILSYFLFPVIFPIFSYIFQEFVTTKLSKRYTPNRKNIEMPIKTVIIYALKFAALSIGLNLLFLPLYLIPVIGFIVYFCLNSYLLGREYFQLSASSLISFDEAVELRKKKSKIIYISGGFLSIMFLTPILNLIAPIVGIIFSWFFVEKISRNITQPQGFVENGT